MPPRSEQCWNEGCTDGENLRLSPSCAESRPVYLPLVTMSRSREKLRKNFNFMSTEVSQLRDTVTDLRELVRDLRPLVPPHHQARLRERFDMYA